MSASLPAQPSLRQLQIQAKELSSALKVRHPEAITRFEKVLGRTAGPKLGLSDAQLILAREYGCENWAGLAKKVEEIRAKSVSPEQIEKFKAALESGEPARVESLLREHPEVKKILNEPIFEFGGLPIMKAVQQKNRALIDVLLAAGADINGRSQWEPGSFGVLDTAGWEEDFWVDAHGDLAEFLISRGARVDIHGAAAHGRIERLRELLDADPELVHARGGDGGTPLHFAKNLEVANLLLERGASLTTRDLDHHSTAAMWQITNEPVLRRLIEAGSPIDIYMACVLGDIPLAERALQEDPPCLGAVVTHTAGDSTFAPDTGGNIYNWRIGHAARPIAIALKNEHRELADFLLARATPAQQIIAHCLSGNLEEARAVAGRHPGFAAALERLERRALPEAVHFRRVPAAWLMIELGFPLDTREGFDRGTLLHQAGWHGEAELARFYLQKHPEWLENKDNNHNSTPLGWACHGSLYCWHKGGDYAGVVRAMLDAGKDLTGLDVNGIEKWAAPDVAALLTEAVKRRAG